MNIAYQVNPVNQIKILFSFKSSYRLLGTIFLLSVVLAGCGIVKPEPIDITEHQERVKEDLHTLYADQAPLTGSLTLEEAIARALKYNYDHRLAIMEAMFHNQQLSAATFAMLPKLTANGSYSYRDNYSASSSISYETRKESLEPSYSSDREKRTADLTLTWTILDFGLGYFQAKQQANRLLIMEERRRRVVNNIVKEVIGAYWKVAAANKLLPMVDDALKETEKALDSYTKIREQGLSSPLGNLEQYRDLLIVANQLRRIQADLQISRIKLAALINVPLNQEFVIARPDPRLLTPPTITASLEELENNGLVLRPDLREEIYQERIDKTEVHKEILRMMPGVSFFAGANYDANSFLTNNYWSEIGARVTMNLLNVFAAPQQIAAANTRIEVTHTRRLAFTVAALVQIHLSYHQYQQALEEFKHTQTLNVLENQIYTIVKRERELEAQSQLALVRRTVDTVRAQIEEDKSLVEIYQLWGNLYFALGGDIITADIQDDDLPAMITEIQKSMNNWWGGTLPFEAMNALTQTTETEQHNK